ncbi:MAG TPA: DinB family protein [Bryobacteraceae bacterium]|nr:DinB family protein [Bryobacteraceae bacterium]
MSSELSQALSTMVRRESEALHAFPERDSGIRHSGPASWSPKEELGHLIDSATNNHVRFVRASIEPEFHGPRYNQNSWVALHGYHEMPWSSIVSFWVHYNNFLADLIVRIPDDKLNAKCFIGDGEPVTLRFLIEDYMIHAQHHLDHLLQREKVTAYPA